MKSRPQNSPLAESELIGFAEHLIEEGKLDQVSAAQIDKALKDFRTASEKSIDSFLKRITPEVRYKLKRSYNKFVKGDFVKTHPGVSAYRLRDLSPKFRKKLDEAVVNSLALIKTQNEQTMLMLEKKFRNWATVPSKELRGSLTGDKAKQKKAFGENVADEEEVKQASWKHLKFVVKDQDIKMTSAMDRITRDELGAIGIVWWTSKDRRVVGDPGGLYPEVRAPRVHGNHYEREGVFYLLRDTWATKAGYVVPRSGVVYLDTLPDGEPGIPIGCRCVGKAIYRLDKIPKGYADCVTKKGEEYAKRYE